MFLLIYISYFNILLVWLCMVLLFEARAQSISVFSPWKRKFEKEFRDVCKNYLWASKYINSPREKIAVFVFEDANMRARKGGLGDRMGGLITTFAWAIRTNRSFVVELKQEGLSTLYRPFASSTELGTTPSWSELSLGRNIKQIDTHYLWCINPKPSQKHCALDSKTLLDQYKVVRVRTNRCYLCRWAINSKIPGFTELQELFSLTSTDNLFELAGCLLRMAMWPTEKLWRKYSEMTHLPAAVAATLKADKPNAAASTVGRIGFHFRCGDQNYRHEGALLHPDMTNHMHCAVASGLQWNGTHAVDELSMASPLDLAECGNIVAAAAITERVSSADSGVGTDLNSKVTYLTNNMQKGRLKHESAISTTTTIAYIASDSLDSSNQIAANLQGIPRDLVVTTPTGCHVDYNFSAACSLETGLVWFGLAVSDYMVLQSYVESDSGNGYLLASSSFARYAMLYGLDQRKVTFAVSGSSGTRDGAIVSSKGVVSSCGSNRKNPTANMFNNDKNETNNAHVNREDEQKIFNALSRLPQGNWVCTGGTIY